MLPENGVDDLKGRTQENVLTPSMDKTVMLSPQETDHLRQQSGAKSDTKKDAAQQRELMNAADQAAYASMDATQILDTEAVNSALKEDNTLLDFIQLNKDVRKMFRIKLKNKSIGVTLRAPEKPIMLDIDKSNEIKVLSILFDNVSLFIEIRVFSKPFKLYMIFFSSLLR